MYKHTPWTHSQLGGGKSSPGKGGSITLTGLHLQKCCPVSVIDTGPQIDARYGECGTRDT